MKGLGRKKGVVWDSRLASCPGLGRTRIYVLRENSASTPLFQRLMLEKARRVIIAPVSTAARNPRTPKLNFDSELLSIRNIDTLGEEETLAIS